MSPSPPEPSPAGGGWKAENISMQRRLCCSLRLPDNFIGITPVPSYRINCQRPNGTSIMQLVQEHDVQRKRTERWLVGPCIVDQTLCGPRHRGGAQRRGEPAGPAAEPAELVSAEWPPAAPPGGHTTRESQRPWGCLPGRCSQALAELCEIPPCAFQLPPGPRPGGAP